MTRVCDAAGNVIEHTKVSDEMRMSNPEAMNKSSDSLHRSHDSTVQRFNGAKPFVIFVLFVTAIATAFAQVTEAKKNRR